MSAHGSPRSRRGKAAAAVFGMMVAAVGVMGASGVASAATPLPLAQPDIVGGEAVDPAPSWAVVLGDDVDSMDCSGSLVASRWVLTAEHCDGETVARIGSAHTFSGGTLVDIKSTVVHSKYDFRLYELESAVDNAPARLARSSPSVGTKATLYGYGKTCGQWGPECPNLMSKDLKSVDAPIVADSECENIDGAGELCMDTTTKATACRGDSGGPAVVGGRVVGVASRLTETMSCGEGEVIYGDVAAVESWITENVGN